MLDALLFAGVVLAIVFFGSAGLGFAAGVGVSVVSALIHLIAPFLPGKKNIANSLWWAFVSLFLFVAFSAALWVVWQVITRLWESLPPL